eukprot:TRINITY_DN1710_c1_g1_i1.p2 TRINITY_DN1710_c1_g1~~TRINITY_DN1710_c1_g1_i1.p2  ORF type:complete len:214 (+),score=0.42 TRINITY_DN1710_c1_g1_i1:350-991(+)
MSCFIGSVKLFLDDSSINQQNQEQFWRQSLQNRPESQSFGQNQSNNSNLKTKERLNYLQYRLIPQQELQQQQQNVQYYRPNKQQSQQKINKPAKIFYKFSIVFGLQALPTQPNFQVISTIKKQKIYCYKQNSQQQVLPAIIEPRKIFWRRFGSYRPKLSCFHNNYSLKSQKYKLCDSKCKNCSTSKTSNQNAKTRQKLYFKYHIGASLNFKKK